MKSMILRGAVVAVAALGLAGCTAYDNWGYGGVSVGYNSGYYRPYHGWYDGFYYPGTGLGLAIVRDVAEIYGGKVELGESEDLGGLLVKLHLPRAPS